MRLTVTYNPNSGGGPAHATSVITQAVTIAPATKFTITSGLSTPVNNGGSITVGYQVEGADRGDVPVEGRRRGAHRARRPKDDGQGVVAAVSENGW